MALRGGTQHSDRGAVIISMLVASLVGGALAVGASIALVKAQSDQDVAPVKKPLVTYDQR
jgi:ethanolamine transporter EutH